MGLCYEKCINQLYQIFYNINVKLLVYINALLYKPHDLILDRRELQARIQKIFPGGGGVQP